MGEEHEGGHGSGHGAAAGHGRGRTSTQLAHVAHGHGARAGLDACVLVAFVCGAGIGVAHLVVCAAPASAWW
jgi:hypothetical protein